MPRKRITISPEVETVLLRLRELGATLNEISQSLAILGTVASAPTVARLLRETRNGVHRNAPFVRNPPPKTPGPAVGTENKE